MLINISDRCNLPSDLHSEIQVHTDGIRLLGTSIGDDEFLQTFLEATESSGFTFEGLQTPIPKLQIPELKPVHQLKTQTPSALATPSRPLCKPFTDNLTKQFRPSLSTRFTFKTHLQNGKTHLQNGQYSRNSQPQTGAWAF